MKLAKDLYWKVRHNDIFSNIVGRAEHIYNSETIKTNAVKFTYCFYGLLRACQTSPTPFCGLEGECLFGSMTYI